MFKALNKVLSFILVLVLLRIAIPEIIHLITAIVVKVLIIMNKVLDLTDAQFPQ